MKKFLLPLLCCLLGTSCMKESTFSMQNFNDFATVYEGKLVADNSLRLTVVENESESEAWKNEGERFFIVCDILNRDLDIKLKSITKVKITEALPYAEEENEPDDPVEVFDHSISGGYINLALKLFKDPAANSAHPVSYYYTSNNNQDEFTFYVLHDGNHENPLYMDEKKLESQEVFFSIPLWNLLKKNTPTALKLCLYQLGKAEDGSYKVEKKTYPLNSGQIVL